MSKLGVIADVHIDDYADYAKPVPGKSYGSRMKVILDSIRKSYQIAVTKGCSGMVINGDYFNRRSSMSPTIYQEGINCLLDAIKDTPAGFNTYIVVGNHDEQGRYTEPNSVDIFNHFGTADHPIHVYSEVTLEDLPDSQLMFVPFSEDTERIKQDIQDKLVQVSKPLTVFAHLGIEGSVSGRWSHRLDGAFNLTDLGWNNPNTVGILAGHYHTRQVLKQEGNKIARYTGDLTELNFNDIDDNGWGADRGMDIVNTVTGEQEFVPIENPKFIVINLDTTSKSSDEIMDIQKDNYVRIVTSKKEVMDDFKEVENADNISFDYKPKQETKSRLGIKSTASEQEIVTAYCKHEELPEEVTKEAIEVLHQALEQ